MRPLPSWQIPFLGLPHFPPALTRFEINTFFTFSDAELAAIRTRRGDELRLASGVHLGFLRMTGTTLDALDRIPAFVLTRVAEQLAVPSIDIATVRSLYRRRQRTLFDHQRWAMATLGIEPFTAHRARALIRAFGPPAATPASNSSSVAVELMQWLYTRGIRIPAARRVRALASRVVRRAERTLAMTIGAEIDEGMQRHWAERLLATRPDTTTTCLEWLGTPPSSRSPGALVTALDKRRFLQELMIPSYPLGSVRLATLTDLARRCRARRPSDVERLPEPTRSLELTCFVRHTWLEINDTVLALADALTTDLRREAHERARLAAAEDLGTLRALLGRVRTFAEDACRTDSEVRAFVLAEIPARGGAFDVSRAHRQREALIADRTRVRHRLAAMTTPRLVAAPGSAIAVMLEALEVRKARYRQPLPEEVIGAMPRCWRAHLAGCDMAKAHAVFDAAALVTLQRALKNGSVWAPESLRHVARGALLIDADTWRSQRVAHYRELNLPLECGAYLRQRLDHLESALEGVRLAAESGALEIDARGVVFERLGAERTDRLFERARKRLVGTLDPVQLSEVIVEIDQAVRFSWQLLERPPRELLALYGALIAHGTARTVAEVALMMPGVSEADIGDMLALLERRDVLRAANDTVVALMYR